MLYIILSLIGILSFLIVSSKWSRKSQIIFIVSSFILGMSLYFLIEFALENTGLIEKGESSIFDKMTMFEIPLYLSMVAGMVAKYFFDKINNGKKVKTRFQKSQFIRPILISPIVFGTIYGSIDVNTSGFLLLIFSFQNGFFWQSVLQKST